MSLLKMSLLLVGVAAVWCRRAQFRGSQGSSFRGNNLASGLVVSPLIGSLGSDRLTQEHLWNFHANNPWGPKIVKVEISHEIVKELKSPKAEVTDWKPVIPSWKSSAQHWKPKDAKHKAKKVSPQKSFYKKGLWKSGHSAAGWNDLKKHALWNEHSDQDVTPQVHVIPTHPPSTHWTSSRDHEFHDGHKDHGYKFNYAVESSKTGDVKTHEEKKTGGVVQGKYTVKEADGSIREVHYTAGKHSGFNAVVVRHH